MSSESTPTTTPPPPGVGGGPTAAPAGPSPEKIGRAFIKQYYKTLLASPSNLNGFYQPDSTVSRGMEPSAPAIPSAFNSASTTTNGNTDDSPGERVRKAFFDWAGNGQLNIDFERGAIDAQESIGGGILVVVTGHMFLPEATKEKPFVHTFFLNNAAGPGRKKHFLVKNDILRFLDPAVAEEEVQEEPEEEVAAGAEVAEEPIPVEEEPAVEESVEESTPVIEEAEEEAEPALLEEEPVIAEPVPIVPVEFEPSADEEKVADDDEEEVEEPIEAQPTITVEDVDPAADEEKIDATETSSAAGSDASPAPSPTGSDGSKKKRNRKKRGGKSRSRSNSPKKGEEAKEEEPEKPKTPGSWASLVASSSGPKPSTQESGKKGRKGSPKGSRGGSDKSSSNQESSAKAAPQSQPAKETPPSPAKTPAITPANQTIQSQRTPEATLFIRNIPDKTQESEVRALFEPHGVKTGNKILGITLNPNRGFCFVDFDGPAAVIAIVNEAATSLVKDPRTGRKIKSSFMAHGRVLDVERKVQSDRNKQQQSGGGGRRFNRSHSPKDGGGRYRGSRGGGGGRRSPPRGGGGGNR